ncbi:MAG: aminoglycoside phosphotransferase family protein [Planctomycetota bacterium]|nr:aminoglycoside phosphotransferase family protein [Planctomycetota bacterium]
MFEVDAAKVLEYFADAGRPQWEQLGLDADDLVKSTAAELAWGVSNIVIRVDTPVRSFVVKQSRKQLRTKIDWFSQLDRIWREVDVLRTLETLLPVGAVPQVLSEDRDNYLFTMEAIDAGHRVWKADLLDGVFDSSIADTLAGHLAAIHRGSTGNGEIAERMGDQTVFDELRIAPFYRYVAETCPRFASPLSLLIDRTTQRHDCLVLADFSPKNILLTSNGPVIVDFETGHYGDPGFDIGFFLSHLLLKTVKHHERTAEAIAPAKRFWNVYRGELSVTPTPEWLVTGRRNPTFERQSIEHLAACMLARVDGKSRVDYLNESWQADLVREYCDYLLTGGPSIMNDAIIQLEFLLKCQ